MRTYKDRRKDNITKGLAAGIGAAVAFTSSKGLRSSLTKSLLKTSFNVAQGIEKHFYGGHLKQLDSAVSEVFDTRYSSLHRFNREVKRGLNFGDSADRRRRDIVDYLSRDVYDSSGTLIKPAIDRDRVTRLFAYSNRNVDLLHTKDIDKSLSDPHYINLMESLGMSVSEVSEFRTQAARALSTFKSNPATVAFTRSANEYFIRELKDSYSGTGWERLAGYLGIDSVSLGEALDPRRASFIKNMFSAGVRKNDIRRRLLTSGGSVSEQESMMVDIMSAWMENDATSNSVDDAFNFAAGLKTGVLKTDDIYYNLDPLKNFTASVQTYFSKHFKLGISRPKGTGRLSEFMTVAAGSEQPILKRILGDHAGEIFKKDHLGNITNTLDTDVFFIGNRAFAQTYTVAEGGVRISNPFKIYHDALQPADVNNYIEESLNKFEVLDVRFGNERWFAEAQRGTSRRENLSRELVEGGPLAPLFDLLDLGWQKSWGLPTRKFSPLGRKLSPDDLNYANHPELILDRIKDGTASASDVQNLLYHISSTSYISRNIKPTELYSSVRANPRSNFIFGNDRSLTRLGGLINTEFSEDALMTSMSEIESIAGGDSPLKHTFFQLPEYRGISDNHLKLLSRRFSFDDATSFMSGRRRLFGRNALLSNFLGIPSSMDGFDNVRNYFHADFVGRVGNLAAGDELITDLISNIDTLGVSDYDKLMAKMFVWGNSNLTRSYKFGVENLDITLQDLADKIRSSPTLMEDLDTFIGYRYPTMNEWIADDMADITRRPLDVLVTQQSLTQRFKESAIESFNQADFGQFKHDLKELRDEITRTWNNKGYSGLKDLTILNSFSFMNKKAIEINTVLSNLGIGLSQESFDQGFYKSFLMKRVLPVAGIYYGEKILELGNEEFGFVPSPMKFASNIIGRLGLISSYAQDKLGITDVMKDLSPLFPGLDKYYRPKSYEEYRYNLTQGYDPVKKNRFNSFNTDREIMGEKERMYLPSWYQRAHSNWETANNADYNTLDSWLHLSPVFNGKLFTGWFKRKHSEDRPYGIGDIEYPEDANYLLLRTTYRGSTGIYEGVGDNPREVGRYPELMNIYRDTYDNAGTALELPQRRVQGSGNPIIKLLKTFGVSTNYSTVNSGNLRNNMPSWIPGQEYFIDYQHGDPYSKIENGLLRLPGEAYDKVHGRKGDYSLFEKLSILADVAPYSSEYKDALHVYRNLIHQQEDLDNPNDANSKSNLMKADLKDLLIRVRDSKQIYNTYEYKFNGDIEYKDFTIERIIDPNTIKVYEQESPIRLSGVRLSRARMQEFLDKQGILLSNGMNLVDSFYYIFGVKVNGKIRVATNKDQDTSNDLLKTTKGVVFSEFGNINRMFLTHGIGLEKEGENTPVAALVKYSKFDRFIGGVFEKLAHADTIFNNRFWRVRSAAEEYERSLYNSDNPIIWTHPIYSIKHRILPHISAMNPIVAPVPGFILGSFFGKTYPGKMVAGKVGAVITTAMSLFRLLKKPFTDDAPKDTRKRRELEEYFDALKYIKSKRLFEQYSNKTLFINEEKLLSRIEKRAEKTKSKLNRLEKQKRRIILSGMSEDKKHRIVSEINQKIKDLATPPEFKRLPKNSAKALLWHAEMEKTMHHYTENNKGTPDLMNIMSAMPKYERELVVKVINKGSKDDKHKVFKLLSSKQRQVLYHYFDEKKPEQLSLYHTLKNKYLPDDTWKGWDEDFDLNNARVITAKEEGLDLLKLHITEPMIEQAEIESQDVPIPIMKGSTDDLRKRISDLLSGRGVRNTNVNINIIKSDRNEFSMNVDLLENTEDKILEML